MYPLQETIPANLFGYLSPQKEAIAPPCEKPITRGRMREGQWNYKKNNRNNLDDNHNQKKYSYSKNDLYRRSGGE